jgi:hypothetical protein
MAKLEDLKRGAGVMGVLPDCLVTGQHLAGLLDARVKITIEIDAEIPSGAPENIIRTVTENCRTLKFENQGFEEE